MKIQLVLENDSIGEKIKLIKSHGHNYTVDNGKLYFHDEYSDGNVKKVDVTNYTISKFMEFLGY